MPGTPPSRLVHGSDERISHPETRVHLTAFIGCLCWCEFIFVGVFPKECQNPTVKQEVRGLAEQWLLRTVCAGGRETAYSAGRHLPEGGQAWCCPSRPSCKQEAATPSSDFWV